MRGHVRKRGKKWCIVVELGKDTNGKRQQKWISGFNSKREAEAAVSRVVSEIVDGRYTPPSDQTVDQFVADWSQDKKSVVKASTWQGYESKLVHHVLPHIGHIKIKELRAQDVQHMFAAIRQGGRFDNRDTRVSEQTILHIYRILHDVLQQAVKWGVIPNNPCLLVNKPRPKAVDTGIWTIDQVQKFLDYARTDSMYPVFFILFTTGMRVGEVLALRWHDVDFERRSISVRRTISYVHGGYLIQQPKTIRSQRTIPISNQLITVLLNVKKEQEKHKRALTSEYHEDLDLVCCTLKGTPHYRSNVTRKWNAIVLRSGLPRIRIHDARHTFASILIYQGIDVKALQTIMGHSEVSTTLKLYAKVIPGATHEAMDKFSEILFDNYTQVSSNVQSPVDFIPEQLFPN